MEKSLTIVAMLAIAVILGCRPREAFLPTAEIFDLMSTEDVATLAERDWLDGTKAASMQPKSRTIDEMQPHDIIVAVNGVPLTKGVYERLMDIKLKSILQRPNMSQYVAQKIWEQHRRTYVKKFVAQRLLFDDALSTGIVSTNGLLATVGRRVTEDAKRTGKTVDKYIKGFGTKWHDFLYERSVDLAISELVKAKIPPIAEVESNFVAAVQQQVSAENAAAKATNDYYRATLAGFRARLLKDEVSFDAVMRKCAGFPGADCLTEDLTAEEIEDEELGRVAFETPLGGIPPIVENESEFFLVKVLGIQAARRDGDGDVLEPERRTLARISLPKTPLLVEESAVALTADLKNQMQIQAIDNYVTQLITNGNNRVVYPHGKVLFK